MPVEWEMWRYLSKIEALQCVALREVHSAGASWVWRQPPQLSEIKVHWDSRPYMLLETQELSCHSCRIISFSSAWRFVILVLGSWVYPSAVEKCLCNLIQHYRTASHPALILAGYLDIVCTCQQLRSISKRIEVTLGTILRGVFSSAGTAQPEQLFQFHLSSALKCEFRREGLETWFKHHRLLLAQRSWAKTTAHSITEL